MIIRSRAPLRISFAGGGTDVKPYCDDKGGAVLNSTINQYVYTTIEEIEDDKIVISSLDLNTTLVYDKDIEEMELDGQIDIVKATINEFKKIKEFKKGFKITTQTDAPPGSGLGTSSAVVVSIVTAFSNYLKLNMNQYEIADLSYKIEREIVKIHGGKQDYYSAAFGGFNFIEFKNQSVYVNPLRINHDIINELEYRTIIIYTGISRYSGKIIEKQINNYVNKKSESIEALDAIKELSYEMKDALITGNVDEFGKLLDYEWKFKRKLAEGVTNDFIDEIYNRAKEAGALGGKISGAGGGGFMFFITKYDKRNEVISSLKSMDLQIVSFSFTKEGAKTWIVK